ncbi:MAG TPA: hypothetical protein VGW79_08765 [Actinomycetota bacterium]|nr:hypothetical protein [Actinomycetota bacterium]
MHFTHAEKVLIVGGTLSLTFSFVMGFVLSRARLKEPSADHAWLLQAHRVALWEGFMLLGLVFAIELSTLSRGLESLAAWLLVAAAALQAASAIANLVQGIPDQFVERRLGYRLAATNAVLGAAGLVILLVGVFKGL